MDPKYLAWNDWNSLALKSQDHQSGLVSLHDSGRSQIPQLHRYPTRKFAANHRPRYRSRDRNCMGISDMKELLVNVTSTAF